LSLISMLQHTVLPWTPCVEPPVSDRNSKSDITVKMSYLGRGGKCEKGSYLHFMLQIILPATSLSISSELWITMYRGHLWWKSVMTRHSQFNFINLLQ
jgi:hypothetical protein